MTIERLAKTLGVMTSDHDGEVLAAARRAVAILETMGKTWAEVLGSPAATARSAEDLQELSRWRSVASRLKSENETKDRRIADLRRRLALAEKLAGEAAPVIEGLTDRLRDLERQLGQRARAEPKPAAGQEADRDAEDERMIEDLLSLHGGAIDMRVFVSGLRSFRRNRGRLSDAQRARLREIWGETLGGEGNRAQGAP